MRMEQITQSLGDHGGGLGIPFKVEGKALRRLRAAEWNAILQIWMLRPRLAGWIPWGKAVLSGTQAFPTNSRPWNLSLVSGGSSGNPDGGRVDSPLPYSLPRPTCPSPQLPEHLSSPSHSQAGPFSLNRLLGPNLIFQSHSLRCRFLWINRDQWFK